MPNRGRKFGSLSMSGVQGPRAHQNRCNLSRFKGGGGWVPPLSWPGGPPPPPPPPMVDVQQRKSWKPGRSCSHARISESLLHNVPDGLNSSGFPNPYYTTFPPGWIPQDFRILTTQRSLRAGFAKDLPRNYQGFTKESLRSC